MAAAIRALAANALAAVAGDGTSLDVALRELRTGCASEREAAFAQECLYGTLRRWFELEARLMSGLSRPLKKKDMPLYTLMLLGLYELEHLSTPAHAVIHETVEACGALSREWAKGLVNALLRRAQRGALPLPANPSPEILHNHPAWFIELLREDWPDHWASVLEANNRHPPLSLRVNLGKTTREHYLETLANAGIEAIRLRHAPAGIELPEPRAISTLPGYAAGLFSVQDEAAQLAAQLLACEAGETVLDACAAPGGKTTHLLELHQDLALTAVDINGRRLGEVSENLARLGLSCDLMRADVALWAPEAAAAGKRFKRILLDAPCSAVGVIRRHPDIRLRRDRGEVERARAKQATLLRALWPLLEPEGSLLYVTCSILDAENAATVNQFLEETSDATAEPIAATWGVNKGPGRQILPGIDGMDGFFFCLLRKQNRP